MSQDSLQNYLIYSALNMAWSFPSHTTPVHSHSWLTVSPIWSQHSGELIYHTAPDQRAAQEWEKRRWATASEHKNVGGNVGSHKSQFSCLEIFLTILSLGSSHPIHVHAGPHLSCAEGSKPGCSTPGGAPQGQSRGWQSPPSPCWTRVFWCGLGHSWPSKASDKNREQLGHSRKPSHRWDQNI